MTKADGCPQSKTPSRTHNLVQQPPENPKGNLPTPPSLPSPDLPQASIVQSAQDNNATCVGALVKESGVCLSRLSAELHGLELAIQLTKDGLAPEDLAFGLATPFSSPARTPEAVLQAGEDPSNLERIKPALERQPTAEGPRRPTVNDETLDQESSHLSPFDEYNLQELSPVQIRDSLGSFENVFAQQERDAELSESQCQSPANSQNAAEAASEFQRSVRGHNIDGDDGDSTTNDYMRSNDYEPEFEWRARGLSIECGGGDSSEDDYMGSDLDSQWIIRGRERRRTDSISTSTTASIDSDTTEILEHGFAHSEQEYTKVVEAPQPIDPGLEEEKGTATDGAAVQGNRPSRPRLGGFIVKRQRTDAEMASWREYAYTYMLQAGTEQTNGIVATTSEALPRR